MRASGPRDCRRARSRRACAALLAGVAAFGLVVAPLAHSVEHLREAAAADHARAAALEHLIHLVSARAEGASERVAMRAAILEALAATSAPGHRHAHEHAHPHPHGSSEEPARGLQAWGDPALDAALAALLARSGPDHPGHHHPGDDSASRGAPHHGLGAQQHFGLAIHRAAVADAGAALPTLYAGAPPAWHVRTAAARTHLLEEQSQGPPRS